jgi:hypothetical protein
MNLDTENDRALTIQQAAAFLATTELVVLDLVKRGTIQASNIGRGKQRPRWRILASDLGKYLLATRRPVIEPAKPRRAVKRSPVKDYFADSE